MIRSAIVRLTLSYLAIIMAFSIVFSFILYRISSRELNLELRQPNRYELGLPLDVFTFERFRDERISGSQQNLQQALVLFNLGVLGLGSIASYALAKRTLKPIEQAMESQSRFTADASHELRTPLTAMQTEIEVALRNKNLNSTDAKALLKSNLEEVAKLRILSDELLRLAQDEKPSLKKISIKPVVESSLKQVQPIAKTKSINIKNEVDGLNAYGNAHSLRDVLVILLDNAIKYSPSGKEVVLSNRRSGEHIQISVADNGPGIKAADLSHIFERFYRADQSRSNNQVEGHGLGLAIAKQLIDAQNGEISVTSKLGKGTKFTITLPAKN